MKANKAISTITAILTAGLAILAFVLSFNALTDLAAQKGVSIPPLFPLVIEGGMIVFSLAALRRNLVGEPARWQWVLVIGSAALATGFNILHAPNDPISRAMAAVPSVFLLLSFETLLNQVKGDVTRSGALATLKTLRLERETLTQEISAHSNQVNTLSAKIEALKAELKQLRQQKRQNYTVVGKSTRDRALEILRNVPNISGNELGRQLGKSGSLGRKLKNELLPTLNGNGKEAA